MSSTVVFVKVEQLNANDEHVKLVQWLVGHGRQVEKDQPICSIETTKCVSDIMAPCAGVIHIAVEGGMVPVGHTIALIAESMAVIETHLKTPAVSVPASEHSSDAIRSTPRAKALADEHGIDLAEVAKMGVQGAVKEADVIKFLSIPATLRPYVEDEGLVPEYEQFVASKLKRVMATTIPLTMEAQLELEAVNDYIEAARRQEVTISLLHIILAALPKVLAKHERFTLFHANQRLFRYRKADIAFIVRAINGQLYMPVVHGLDVMSIVQIVEAMEELALEANRGRLSAAQSMGACFCVSYLSNKSISRFEAFTDNYQSAMLAVAGGGVGVPFKKDQKPSVRTAALTLTYDHSLIDGWMASAFLSDLIEEIGRVVACPFKTA